MWLKKTCRGDICSKYSILVSAPRRLVGRSQEKVKPLNASRHTSGKHLDRPFDKMKGYSTRTMYCTHSQCVLKFGSQK